MSVVWFLYILFLNPAAGNYEVVVLSDLKTIRSD